MMYEIKIEFAAGTLIEEAVEVAVNTSKTLQQPLKFNFNGVEIGVDPASKQNIKSYVKSYMENVCRLKQATKKK